jgi:tetratricopeptide (TPR) repeat protein
VLNDLEVASIYLAQYPDLRRQRIAVKLEPDSAYAQFKLVAKLIEQGHPDEAKGELAALLRLDPNGWMALFAQGALALVEGSPEKAAEFARKAADSGPVELGNFHFLLGCACQKQGKLREAREAFRIALRCTLDDNDAQMARSVLADINEKIGSD